MLSASGSLFQGKEVCFGHSLALPPNSQMSCVCVCKLGNVGTGEMVAQKRQILSALWTFL